MKHIAMLALAAIVPALAPPISNAQTECDRKCLIAVADGYFAALAAHDPSKAKLAPKVKFTEQTKALEVGEGLWKTTTEAPKTFKIYVPDPVSKEIGALAMLESDDKPTMIGLRLKVENGRITEAEHLLAPITNERSLANLATPRPGLLATIPAKERLPREVLLLFAHGYYDAIEQSDGKAVPFADECVRRENGMQTAGPRPASATPSPAAGGAALPGSTGPAQLCGPQLDTRAMSYIDSIDLRRVRIADPETGLVFGMSMFRHAMTNKKVTVLNPDGTRGERTMNFEPFDLPAAHIIKVRGNKIHEIEAMGYMMPLYSKNGWSEFTR
jgi:hypothetical protein